LFLLVFLRGVGKRWVVDDGFWWSVSDAKCG
jgi:hypothetical protein